MFLPTAFFQYLVYTETFFFWNPCPTRRTRRRPWPPGGHTFLFKSRGPGLTRRPPPGFLTQLQFVFAAFLDAGAVDSVQAEASSWLTVPR